jgi:signal transduction histidine kinase
MSGSRSSKALAIDGFNSSSALAAVADLLSIPRNSPLIYENALIKVLEVLNLEHGNLRLLSAATGEIDLMTEKGFPAEYAEKYHTIKIGERSAGKILRTRGPVLWDNIQTDPSCAYLQLKKRGINSMLGVPLLAREEIIGTLIVASPQRGRFREPEIQLLAAMGKVVGIAIESNRLLTALESNVDDLTRLTLKLEESDGIKHRLLSVMSHELRTPISIILGNVELLTDGTFGKVNEQQKESLMTVRRSSAGLLFHVENALEVSQLEGGGVAVYPERFVLDHVQSTVMELLGDEIKRKQLKMDWEIDPKMPPIFSDQIKITKVFRNLVDNAIKFTEKGGVVVRVLFLPEEQTAQCEVEDTGIGIPPAQFQVIFDPFHQIDSSHTRLYGGMGLGLRTVKKTLELLGGGIEVESKVGKGTRFKFWFPIRWGRQE